MDESTWIEETLGMIKDARDERTKAMHRMEAATNAIRDAEAEIGVLQRLLSKYRHDHGLPQVVTRADPEVVAVYENKSGRGMIETWAAAHDGRVVMIDLAKALVAAGLFRGVTQATGSLYPTAGRMTKEGNLRKERPGVYAVTKPTPQRPPAPGLTTSARAEALAAVERLRQATAQAAHGGGYGSGAELSLSGGGSR